MCDVAVRVSQKLLQQSPRNDVEMRHDWERLSLSLLCQERWITSHNDCTLKDRRGQMRQNAQGHGRSLTDLHQIGNIRRALSNVSSMQDSLICHGTIGIEWRSFIGHRPTLYTINNGTPTIVKGHLIAQIYF